ncbi:MAG: hypothetical protein R2865_03230 [Deinococcales bacterium]
MTPNSPPHPNPPQRIIFCGPNLRPNPALTNGLQKLSEQSGYPILAEPLSNQRFAWQNYHFSL